MNNEDKNSDSEEQMWAAVQGTTQFLRTVLVVSSQASSLNLAQMNSSSYFKWELDKKHHNETDLHPHT